MKKIVLPLAFVSAAMLSSSPVVAGGMFDFWTSDKLPEVSSSSSYEEIQGALSGFGARMSRSHDYDSYRALEKSFVKLIHKVYPNTKSYWNDVYTYSDMSVVQADKLIDLERIKVGKAVMGAKMEAYTAQMSPRKSDGAEYPVLMTSHIRMKSGLAPIGPDNEPLLLCRLHNDSRASYFEVSATDAWKILNAVGSAMTIDQACMSEDVIPGYWKHREKNLFNSRGKIIRSKRSAINSN